MIAYAKVLAHLFSVFSGKHLIVKLITKAKLLYLINFSHISKFCCTVMILI